MSGRLLWHDNNSYEFDSCARLLSLGAVVVVLPLFRMVRFYRLSKSTANSGRARTTVSWFRFSYILSRWIPPNRKHNSSQLDSLLNCVSVPVPVAAAAAATDFVVRLWCVVRCCFIVSQCICVLSRLTKYLKKIQYLCSSIVSYMYTCTRWYVKCYLCL